MVGPRLIVPEGMEDPSTPERGARGEHPVVSLDSGPPAPRYASNPRADAAVPPLVIDGAGGPPRGAEQPRAELVARREVARPAEPATATARDEVHQNLVRNAERLVSDINRSNTVLEHGPRLLAETTLRVLSLGSWGGTGITQHSTWQRDIAARRDVINPSTDAQGVIQLTPTQWESCFNEVQNHKDDLNRKWGNCAEEAASMAHVIHSMINNDPSMAGLQVRQTFGINHSWAEVRYPSGQVMVYDPWARLTGALEDMPAKYRESVSHTAWFGRRP